MCRVIIPPSQAVMGASSPIPTCIPALACNVCETRGVGLGVVELIIFYNPREVNPGGGMDGVDTTVNIMAVDLMGKSELVADGC